jgi:glycosyltransferase involved in cell wall biosynthesis
MNTALQPCAADATAKGTQPPLVSIIIPVHNQAAETRQCLEAIIAHTSSGLYDGIIVDNASTEPETIDLLRALDGEVRILRNTEKSGFASACNQAAAYAQGKYLLFLHNDTLPQPGWLQVMVGLLESDQTAGAVGAQLTNPDGTGQNSVCSEVCLLVRRELFAKMEGFNLNYEPAHYLCFGLRALGYHVLYCPDAVIVHGEGKAIGVPWEEILRPLTPAKLKFNGFAKSAAYPQALAEYAKNPLVLLELSSRCNFHCDYCRSPQSQRQKSFMKKELFVHLLGQLKEITTHPLRLHVDGEPTLHPQFLELALLANAAGYTVALATNGSLLKPEFLQIDMAMILNISCSPEELQARSPIKFSHYVERIHKYILAWKTSASKQSIFLKIYTSSQERNTPGAIEQKRQFARKFIQDLGFAASGWTCDSDQAMDFLASNAGGGCFALNLQARTEGGCYPNANLLPESMLPLEHGFCDSPWKTLAVLSDGTVAPCCVDLSGETGFTRPDEVWNTPLKEIWLNHPGIQKVRQDFLADKVTLPICQKCLEIAPWREFYLWVESFPFSEK